MVKLLTPENGAEISLHTEYQQRFFAKRKIDKELPVDFLEWDISKKDGNRTTPAPAVLTFEPDRVPAVVKLSDKSDMSDPRIISTEGTEVEFWNLKINTVYYWQVNESEIRTFKVKDETPRMINLPGVPNVRDIGGWKTDDGRRIKQGCIYRGSELNGYFNPPDSTKQMAHDELGIKTDLDFRGEALDVYHFTESAIGSDVKYVVIPISDYDVFLTDPSKWRSRGIYEVCADKNNFPIYAHCMGGADRTGSFFYILEGALGVSADDARFEYEITTLLGGGRNPYFIGKLMPELDTYGPFGGTFKEKCVAYLHTLGIDDATIEQIRNNLLEEDN